jgi:hypothetical protein
MGEVGVERDPLAATDAKRREAVLVFEAAELPLHGSASGVHVAPALGLAGNERVADMRASRFVNLPSRM